MFQVEEKSARQLAASLAKGETTSYELVLTYMERIARIDKSGPTLNSVLELNPDALYIAGAMDRERKKGRVRSPMHGIPVLIKDTINTADKMRTSAGSIALADNFAPYDATIVKKLRDAGMVVMGKTNMTELSNYMSYTMRNGYSSRGGQVINPYNPKGEVWGSSSGSAVAVSANLCAAAIGTETDGSIIWPSHVNGTVGMRPTSGLISRYGTIPVCTTQGTPGPMTRTVEDAAALLNILAGPDEKDPSTWSTEDLIPDDYTAFLDLDGLSGLRLGINRGYFDDFSDDQKAVAEKSFGAMREKGAVIVEGISLPHLNCDSSIMFYEFKMCLNAYLATCTTTQCKSLKDIIDFYEKHRERLKYGMTTLQDAQDNTSGTCTEPKYILDRLESLRISRKDGLDKVMNENDLDILVCPGITDCSPISGYPSIIVPAGYGSDNMPFGMTFVGRPFSEPTLFKAAYSFEQATKARKAPVFPTER